MPWSITSPLAFLGGPADWVIIFVVALIIFGPQKLPEVGQQLGKALREFRKIADEVTGATKSIHDEIAGVTGQIKGQVESPSYSKPVDEPVASSPRPVLTTTSEVDDDPMAMAPQVGAEPTKPAGLRLSTDPGSKTE